MIDGACFADFPNLVRSKSLFARSLFLDHADHDIAKAGPWLISLAQKSDARQALMTLGVDSGSDGQRFLVYWRCEAGETALYSHLRTINMARIPAWAAAGRCKPPTEPERSEEYENVYFRHFDPDVLDALLPCLGARQFSRIIGPSEEIAFTVSPNGLRRVLHDQSWPLASPGMLTLDNNQCVALIARRCADSHRRIAAYLREFALPQTRDLSNLQLLRDVERYVSEANTFGAHDEEAQGIWSYMQITSTFDLSKDIYVISYMANSAHGPTPDKRMKSLFDKRISLLNVSDDWAKAQ